MQLLLKPCHIDSSNHFSLLGGIYLANIRGRLQPAMPLFRPHLADFHGINLPQTKMLLIQLKLNLLIIQRSYS
jgi:hypothetical protein